MEPHEYEEDRFGVFVDDNMPGFQGLVNRHDVIVGYNNISFDNRVCAANGIIVPDDKSYDLLVEIWKAAGLDSSFQWPSHAGYGLDAVIKANFPGFGKTGHGAVAPANWQKGKIGDVVDYCLTDVWLTRRILNVALQDIEVKDPKTGEMLSLQKPK